MFVYIYYIYIYIIIYIYNMYISVKMAAPWGFVDFTKLLFALSSLRSH